MLLYIRIHIIFAVQLGRAVAELSVSSSHACLDCFAIACCIAEHCFKAFDFHCKRKHFLGAEQFAKVCALELFACKAKLLLKCISHGVAHYEDGVTHRYFL